jgi:3-hydroxybutyryl-CoA dehydratase
LFVTAVTDNRTFQDPPSRTFEDFRLGDVILTRGRTIEASDFITFAGLTGDHYPLHVDEQFAGATRFGARIAHGPLTFSIAVGLVGMTGYYGDGIVALLEITRLRALAPVLAGDTLCVRAEVTGHEPGDNPKYGTLTVEYSVRNQREEEVMRFTQVMLARRAPKEDRRG